VTVDAQAQPRQSRIVVDTGVSCRSEPRLESTPAMPLPLGAVFVVDREVQVDATTWYFWSPSCWISGPRTTEYEYQNLEPAFVRMLDRLLERNDIGFEDLVEASNLLRVDWFPRTDPRVETATYAEVFAMSGSLQFRWLRLLDRALRTGDFQADAVNGNPLKKAWMWSLRDLVVYHEPGGGWYVRPEAYWNLFQSNKSASWADELAWVASEHVRLGDECDLTCSLRLIIEGPLQYWARLPKGERVADAVQRAASRANALRDRSCDDSFASPQERRNRPSVVQMLIEQIRNSLDNVQIGGKRNLLDSLDDVGRRCGK
jgi:hypothetical protein